MEATYTIRSKTVQTNEGLVEVEEYIDLRTIDWEQKFMDLLLNRRFYSDGQVLEITSRDQQTRWRVEPDEDDWLTCTCPAYAFGVYPTRYGRVCKHTLLFEFVSRHAEWMADTQGFEALLCPEAFSAVRLRMNRPPLGESTAWELRVDDGWGVIRHAIPDWAQSKLRGYYVGTPTWITLRREK